MMPKKAPKRHPKSSKAQQKRDPKMDPEIIVFLTSFWAISGAILGPEFAPKGDQKWDHFWNPQVRADRGQGVAILRIKQEWWNCYGYWNYIRQKKGRDGKAGWQMVKPGQRERTVLKGL